MNDIDFDCPIMESLMDDIVTSVDNECLQPVTEDNLVEQLEQDWKCALVEDERSGML